MSQAESGSQESAQATPAGSTFFGMAWAGVRHHPWLSFAIALGIALATTVIVGALLVGDSMRGSLRALTTQRLGTVDFALTPGRFFDPNSIMPPGENSGFTGRPVIFFDRSVVETGRDASDGGDALSIRRVANVQTIAIDPSFWEMDVTGLTPPQLDDDSIALNHSLATELGVGVGDQVTLRLPSQQAIPADSPLGHSESTTEGLPNLRISSVVPDRGLGRFSLLPSQAMPMLAFVDRSNVADLLDRPGQANGVLIADDSMETSLRTAASRAEAIQKSLN
ncbi:MAG: ABC transporter permease, partial [Planctomycetota bacterium]